MHPDEWVYHFPQGRRKAEEYNTLRTQQPTQEVTITSDQINAVQAKQNAQRQQSTAKRGLESHFYARDKALPGSTIFESVHEECHTLRHVI